MGRTLGTALTTLLTTGLLACLATGCGGEKKVDLPPLPPSTSTSPSPTSTGPEFSMPSPGDAIGGEVSARPQDEESAQGASLFAAWTLSLLLHTPREDAITQRWLDAAGTGCEACRTSAGIWQDQAAKGQVFRYAATPRFVRTVVRAQKQGNGWFVEYEAAVPRGTLRQGGRVLQTQAGGHPDYTFSLGWVDGRWALEDFHVLG